MRRIRIGIIAATTGVVLLAGACSGEESEGKSSNKPDSGSVTADNGIGVDSGNHVEALGGSSILFGEPANYDDGLTIIVSKPKTFVPSPNVATGDESKYVKFTVRLVNTSKRRFLPTDVSVMVASRGGQAGEVFDAEQEIIGPPPNAVPPGGKARWVQVFGVEDPADVSVVVQAGLDRMPVAVSRS